MALSKSQRSLKAWGKQKWTTKSGKKSSETGERYLPEKAIKSLSSSEYAATTRAKRQGTKKGKTIIPPSAAPIPISSAPQIIPTEASPLIFPFLMQLAVIMYFLYGCA